MLTVTGGLGRDTFARGAGSRRHRCGLAGGGRRTTLPATGPITALTTLPLTTLTDRTVTGTRAPAAGLAALTGCARLPVLPLALRSRLRGPPRWPAHVHGAGQAVLLHEQLELDLLSLVGVLGLAGRQVAQGVQALAATAGVVGGVGEQDGMGHARRGARHGGDGLAHEGEIGDAGGAV